MLPVKNARCRGFLREKTFAGKKKKKDNCQQGLAKQSKSPLSGESVRENDYGVQALFDISFGAFPAAECITR